MSLSLRYSQGMPPFHLAIPVDDLDAARHFYVDVLGCSVGRIDDAWIDFDFFGHQVTAHLHPDEGGHVDTNQVDGDDVPVRHFGVVLGWDDWEALAQRLHAAAQAFLMEPHVRFVGQIGEQGTFFLNDPAGNALEFKAFRDPSRLFAS
ncbi:MAG: VOC family protein [Myxococcota bacterium]